MTFTAKTDIPARDRAPAVLTITGDVDVMNAGRLRELLADEYAADSRHLVLDLQAVSFLDSTGLGILVATHRRTRNVAGSLRLVVADQGLLQLLVDDAAVISA